MAKNPSPYCWLFVGLGFGLFRFEGLKNGILIWVWSLERKDFCFGL